jgi:MFS family permease
MFSSLQASGFRPFLVNRMFASVDMIVRMAVHGWLVLELSDDSAFWVGIYSLFLGLGQFMFSSVAGALADRIQRRTLLLIEGFLSAGISFSLAAITYYELATLEFAIGIAFLIGCLRAVNFTATNRFIYDIVGSQQLVNGAALWRAASTPMMILGSITVGFLLEGLGIWAAYAFMGVCLIVALPFLVFVNVRGTTVGSSTGLIRQTIEGLKYAANSPSLKTLFTVSMVMECFGFAYIMMIPVMAKVVLDVGGTGLGWIQAGVGAGAFLANVVMASKGDTQNKPRVVYLNAIGGGIALIAFALSRSLPVSVMMAMAVMAFLNASDLSLGALMQLVAPPSLRGRAVSLHSLAISFTAFGGFVMGAAGSIVGVPLVIALGGGSIVINSLFRKSAIMRVEEFRPGITPEK